MARSRLPKLAPKTKAPKKKVEELQVEQHTVKVVRGLGQWRRVETQKHDPKWYVIVESDDGRQLQGCSVSLKCIETKVARRGMQGYIARMPT